MSPSPERVDPKVGDRVRLCLRDGSRLRALVKGREGQSCRLILATASRPAGAALEEAEPVEVCVYRPDAVYLHRAAVQFRPDPGHVGLLLDHSSPQRLQRREYFRMPVRCSFLLRLPEKRLRGVEGITCLEDQTASSSPAQWALFSLVNLSGGGCLCLDPQGLLPMDAVYDARLHTGDDEPPLVLQVAVVRRTQVKGDPAAGLRFLGLKEKSRQRIMAALFREYRKMRARQAQRERRKSEPPPPSSPA